MHRDERCVHESKIHWQVACAVRLYLKAERFFRRYLTLERADFKQYTTLLMRIQEISSIFSTWCKTSLPMKGNVDVSLYDLGWKRKLTGKKSQWNRKTGSNTNKPKLDKIGCSFNKQVRRRPRRRPLKKSTAFWGQKFESDISQAVQIGNPI